MLRALVLVVGAAAVVGVNGSADASSSRPTVAQVKAAIATHSDDFILANSYARDAYSGHGWIDLKTGAGRWKDGDVVYLQTVTPRPHDSTVVNVTYTTIDYAAHTWSRTNREESAQMAPPTIGDPLDALPESQFRLLGVDVADGRPAYHFRSSYTPYMGSVSARLDVWFSTDQSYLIRYTWTTRGGSVIQRIDNWWLPRTRANLALLNATIPRRFKQVFVAS